MDAGIREARGRSIAILGAHCDYTSDYLRVCAALPKDHPEAGCVGGPIISVGKSLFGQAVAAAMSHPAGIGNARNRRPDFEGYAEGACCMGLSKVPIVVWEANPATRVHGLHPVTNVLGAVVIL